MIEFIEKFRRDGTSYATLVSEELKAAGSTCVIRQIEDDWEGKPRFERKTCNGSPSGTRYQGGYTSLEQA